MPTPTRRRKPEPTTEAMPPMTGDVFCGIDPGLSGGIVFISADQEWGCPAPIVKDAKGRRQFDRERMVALLKATPVTFAAIERVDAAPMQRRRQGTAGMFSFGKGFGLWIGILEALSIPYVEVPPRTWKRAVLSGTAKDKQAAIDYATRFRPGVCLKPPRARKPHDGVADACCLAEYAMGVWRVRMATKNN
jgi:hypothetical protein